MSSDPASSRQSLGHLLAGMQSSGGKDALILENDTLTTANFTIDPYYLYLLMVDYIRSDDVYMLCLAIFAFLSICINLVVVITLLYHLKLKVRSRHVIFINLCVTEMMSALWEVYKDNAVEQIDIEKPETYAMLVLVIFLQSASSLTVVMMVALGADTYFAIKKPLRYMSLCGRSPKVGILVVIVSWFVMGFFWTLVNCLQSWFSRLYGMSVITIVNLSVEAVSIFVMIVILFGSIALQLRILLEVRHTMTPTADHLRRSSATLKSSSMHQLTRKSFFFTMTSILVTVVFWMPYSVYRMVLSIEIMTTSLFDYENHLLAFQVLHIVYSLNTFIIPALYAFRIRNPFKSLCSMVKEIYCRIRHPNDCQCCKASSYYDDHQRNRPRRSTAVRRVPTSRSLSGDRPRATLRRVRTASEPGVIDCDQCGSVFAVSTSIRIVDIEISETSYDTSSQALRNGSSSTVTTELTLNIDDLANSSTCCNHSQRHNVIAALPSNQSSSEVSNTDSQTSDSYIDHAEHIFYI